MGVSKVIYYGETLVDMENVTVSPETLAKGTTALDASGELIEGTLEQTQLPELTNPGTAEDLAAGKQLIDAEGNVVEGNLDVQQSLEDYLAAIHHKTVTEIINSKMTGAIVANWQYGNDALVKVDLSLITTLGDSAFAVCTSLANVSMPALTEISAGVFGTNYALEKLYLPSLTKMTSYGWEFASCTKLTRAYFPKLTNILSSSFYNCRRLVTLVLGGDSVCTLGNTNAFTDSPIGGNTGLSDGEMGYIYVPSSLVDSYKAATNWTAYADQIRAIEDYPEVLEGWE